MSAIKRYVLFYSQGDPPADDVQMITQHPALRVIDQTNDRAFLVEASQVEIDLIRKRMTEWHVDEEIIHPGP